MHCDVNKHLFCIRDPLYLCVTRDKDDIEMIALGTCSVYPLAALALSVLMSAKAMGYKASSHKLDKLTRRSYYQLSSQISLTSLISNAVSFTAFIFYLTIVTICNMLYKTSVQIINLDLIIIIIHQFCRQTNYIYLKIKLTSKY